MIAGVVLAHWFHYFYAPQTGPWYAGNVWGNVFVIAVIAPLGWVWSRTRFWPLVPLSHGIARLEAHHRQSHEHDEWAARQIARMHLHLTGRAADAHPHYPDIGGERRG